MPSRSEKKTTQYQLRCSEEWLERVQRAADALEMPVASYIRMVVTERMDQTGIPKDVPTKGRKPKGGE